MKTMKTMNPPSRWETIQRERAKREKEQESMLEEIQSLYCSRRGLVWEMVNSVKPGIEESALQGDIEAHHDEVAKYRTLWAEYRRQTKRLYEILPMWQAGENGR